MTSTRVKASGPLILAGLAVLARAVLKPLAPFHPVTTSRKTAFGPRASFLGVIATARDGSARLGDLYPILADPDRRIIKACEAEHSAYVMLVAPCAIEAMWPGVRRRS